MLPFRVTVLFIACLVFATGVQAGDKKPTTAPAPACTVRIKTVRVSFVPLRSKDDVAPPPAGGEDSALFNGLKDEQAADDGHQKSSEKLLIVRIEIRNEGTEVCTYHSLNGSDEKCPTMAGLRDDAKNAYALADFGDSVVVGAVKGATKIEGGRSIGDVLVFEIPPKTAKGLKLTVPAANIGATGQIEPVPVSLNGVKLAGG